MDLFEPVHIGAPVHVIRCAKVLTGVGKSKEFEGLAKG